MRGRESSEKHCEHQRRTVRTAIIIVLVIGTIDAALQSVVYEYYTEYISTALVRKYEYCCCPTVVLQYSTNSKVTIAVPAYIGQKG